MPQAVEGNKIEYRIPSFEQVENFGVHQELAGDNAEVQNPLDDYIIKERLGKGASGRVELGLNKRTGALVALKIIDKKLLTDQQESQVDQEIRIQLRFSHPNIVKCLQSFKNNKEILIVLEYVGKDLFEDRELQVNIIR